MTIIALEALTFGLNRLADAAQQRGHKICLLTRDRSVYAYELSQPEAERIEVIDIDTFDMEKVEAAIAAIEAPKGLLNLTDTWSLAVTDLAKKFNFHGQDAESVHVARNKNEMRSRLYEKKLSKVRSFTINPYIQYDLSSLQGLKFPVIVKDSAGTGSAHVWIAKNRSQLDQILQEAAAVQLRNDNLVIEPFFNGTLYSAEAVTWDNETRVYAITSRIMSAEPNFREEAMSVPIQFEAEKMAEISGWIGKILAAIGYSRGISHTEFIITHDGMEVVEINPRAAGAQVTEAICQAYDYNVLQAYIEMALGERPALLDVPLTLKHGMGSALLYANTTGIFESIDGLERLHQHPGDPVFYQMAFPGKKIQHLRDQRSCLGILLAKGETTEIAMLNAISATGKLNGLITQ